MKRIINAKDDPPHPPSCEDCAGRPNYQLRQVFQIRKVFKATRGFFIGFQVRQVNNIDFDFVKRIHNTGVVTFFKFHA